MRRLYASKLTKEDLIRDGITNITKDGHIFKGDKEVFPNWIPSKRPYLGIMLYERDAEGHLIKGGDRIYKYKKADGSIGETVRWQAKPRTFGLHRIMWAWHYGEVPEGMVVDHIDNKHETLYDYRLDNLQLLSPKENLAKEKTDSDTRFLKCKMTKPRSFYEKNLLRYEEEYEKAKKEHNAEDAHRCRSSISNARARLRYWDSHKEEYEKYATETKESTKMKNAKEQLKKEINLLKEYKKIAKENGDLKQWHMLCSVIKNWEDYTQDVRDNILDCATKHAICRYIKED